MSLIEGIGDEVVEFFIGLIIVIIGIAAWWSTRIAERPLIRTVLVFERRTQSHRSQANSTQHSGSASDERRVQPEQRNYVRELPATEQEVSEPTAETAENKPPAAGTSVSPDRQGAGDMTSRDREGPSAEEEQSAIVESMDSDACVLRRRRLEFFQSRQETLIASPASSDVDVYDAIDNPNTDQLPETSTTDADTESMEENLPPSRSESTETTETTVDEDDIRIKLKYINDDLKLVNGKLQEPLGDFKRRHFEFELANDKLVRLIFNGQVLQRDDVTLQGCGMFDNCVVHCLVHQKRNTPGERNTGSGSNLGSTGASSANDSIGRGARGLNGHSNSQQQGREWDLGNLFFAIVSFVLGAAWYFRYEYAQLYTVTATVALVGLTGIFTVLLVGMYFPDPEPPVQPMRS